MSTPHLAVLLACLFAVLSLDGYKTYEFMKMLDQEMSAQMLRSMDGGDLGKERGQQRARAMEKLLEVLGISTEGRFMGNHEAPLFMRQLYKRVAHSPGGIFRKPFDADLVRSYFDKGNSQSDFLIFDVSGLPSSERVVEAEIHLYRMSFLRHSGAPYHLIRVYQALSNDTSLPIDSHRLLSVQHVSSVPSSGWHILNVREAVVEWTKGKRPNLGLIVTVSSPTAWGERRLTRAEVRISRGPNSRQPILVLFNSEGVAKAKLRHPYTGYPFYYGRTEEEEEVEPQLSPNDSVVLSEGCERKSLYVDFRRMGWSSWIIAPKAFDLGECHGKCNFPLDRKQNPTNHAAIQSIIHELALVHGMRKPCCVPTSLLPLHILYFDRSGNVVLKTTSGVVAEKCACR